MREGEGENNEVENQELGVLRLTVDDKILDNIKDILLSNRYFIESQNRISKADNQTEIKITLREAHKELTLDAFMSQLQYNKSHDPFAQLIDVKTLDFLSKYTLNQLSLKNCIANLDDPDLLDSILSKLEEPVDLSDIERLEVINIKPTSSLILLKFDFDKTTLLKTIFDVDKNYSIDNQVQNIKNLIEHDRFSWDEVGYSLESFYLFGIPIELLRRLVTDCQMPEDKALAISQHCTINGNSVNAPSSEDEYNQFLQSIGKFTIREDQESLVEISGDLQ